MACRYTPQQERSRRVMTRSRGEITRKTLPAPDSREPRAGSHVPPLGWDDRTKETEVTDTTLVAGRPSNRSDNHISLAPR